MFSKAIFTGINIGQCAIMVFIFCLICAENINEVLDLIFDTPLNCAHSFKLRSSLSNEQSMNISSRTRISNHHYPMHQSTKLTFRHILKTLIHAFTFHCLKLSTFCSYSTDRPTRINVAKNNTTSTCQSSTSSFQCLKSDIKAYKPKRKFLKTILCC